MKIKQTQAIIFSGVIWFGVGLMLLAKGLNFLIQGGQVKGNEQMALILIAISLMVGFLKGKFVLTKSAKRVISRIQQQTNPFPLKRIYSRSYCLLLCGMVLMGLSMRFLPIPLEIRGAVDVAIGSALINGALFYFRTVAVS